MDKFLPKLRDFWLKNEQKIVLLIGFCLISAISFEFGYLQGQKWQSKPLVIEKPADTPAVGVTSQEESSVASGDISTAKSPRSYQLEAKSSSCAYVGSRNSTKFYLPTCSFAKRVKPENLVCFKSAQEATSQGRTESKCN